MAACLGVALAKTEAIFLAWPSRKTAPGSPCLLRKLVMTADLAH